MPPREPSPLLLPRSHLPLLTAHKTRQGVQTTHPVILLIVFDLLGNGQTQAQRDCTGVTLWRLLILCIASTVLASHAFYGRSLIQTPLLYYKVAAHRLVNTHPCSRRAAGASVPFWSPPALGAGRALPRAGGSLLARKSVQDGNAYGVERRAGAPCGRTLARQSRARP